MFFLKKEKNAGKDNGRYQRKNKKTFFSYSWQRNNGKNTLEPGRELFLDAFLQLFIHL
jgi:hypothetical protein